MGKDFVETAKFSLLKSEGIAVFKKGFAVSRLATFLRFTVEDLSVGLEITPGVTGELNTEAELLPEDWG